MVIKILYLKLLQDHEGTQTLTNATNIVHINELGMPILLTKREFPETITCFIQTLWDLKWERKYLDKIRHTNLKICFSKMTAIDLNTWYTQAYSSNRKGDIFYLCPYFWISQGWILWSKWAPLGSANQIFSSVFSLTFLSPEFTSQINLKRKDKASLKWGVLIVVYEQSSRDISSYCM